MLSASCMLLKVSQVIANHENGFDLTGAVSPVVSRTGRGIRLAA